MFFVIDFPEQKGKGYPTEYKTGKQYDIIFVHVPICCKDIKTKTPLPVGFAFSPLPFYFFSFSLAGKV
jgi:hypothetical protein